jgi:uncharacterized membrane protein YphA (DoxX/SURF4 family)
MSPNTGRTRDGRKIKSANVLLWTAQGLLAGLFLFAGVLKLTMPIQVLAQQTGLPGGFMRFIAVAEVLGALGLILPGLLRVKRGLTPMAAAGLAIIMVGAIILTLAKNGAAPALFPLVVELVLVFVIWGRRTWARAPASSARPEPSVPGASIAA